MDSSAPGNARRPSERTPSRLDATAKADLAFAATIVVAIVGTAILYLLFPAILIVLMISGLLSYALLPVVDWLEKRKLSRTLAVLLVALVGVGLLVTAAVLLAPTVASELQGIPEAAQKIALQLMGLWESLRERLPGSVVSLVDRFTASVREGLGEAMPGAGAVSEYAGTAASGITALASALVLVPIFVFLMLRGYHPFINSLERFVPPRWRRQYFTRTAEADAVLSGFVRGQLLVALILAVLYSVAFSIIGIPLAIVIGVLAGFGELIPYVGNAIALVLGSLLALVGGQPIDVLWVLGSYAVIQAVQGSFISPYIMGRKVHLSPITVIVALAIGAQLLGIIGMVAAVPASALLKVAARAATDAYRRSPFFRRGSETPA